MSKRKGDDGPHPIDVYVGGRIRLRRIQLTLSQGQLAAKIGVSFQAVQKYESGDIRISASRLYDTAVALGAPPGDFFEGYGTGDGQTPTTLAIAAAEESGGPFNSRETLTVVRAMASVKDPELKGLLLRFAQRIGELSISTA